MPKLYPLSKSALRDLIRPDGRDWLQVGSTLPAVQREEPTREEGPLAWYVVMTNPRCEKRAQSGLIDKGFAVYFPQYREERIKKGARCIVSRSLFSRYIFVLARYGSWPRITSTDGVQALIRDQGSQGMPLAVSDSVIAYLMLSQTAGDFDVMLNDIFAKGDEVRVLKRPFFACVAVVEKVNGKNVDILVDLFGRRHKITVPLDHVESL